MHGTSAIATGLIAGKSLDGRRVELAYFGHNGTRDVDRLFTLKKRRLREEGHEIIADSLRCSDETTPRCVGWIAYIPGGQTCEMSTSETTEHQPLTPIH